MQNCQPFEKLPIVAVLIWHLHPIILTMHLHPVILTMHLHALILTMNVVDLILRWHHTGKLRVHVVQVSLHPATLCLALATVLLADMAVVAVAGPTFALLWTRAAHDDILKHMPGLWLELVVVVGAAIHGAHALKMEAVTGLLFMEARVVDGPFFLCRWANVVVQTLRVFVQRNIAWCCTRRKGGRDMGSI
jgi:hypothetical protein